MRPDRLMAGKNFGRACDLGLEAGCASLAEFVQHSGQDVFLRSCGGGDGVSCFILGWQMDKGLGVAVDPARAAVLFERSCAAGWARGCFTLGEFYRQGEGVPVDPARAMDNYAKGCDGGNAPSCLGAAVLYRRGIGVTPNEIAAGQLIERACQLGLRDACPDGRNPGMAAAAQP